jgi:putative endonuclease
MNNYWVYMLLCSNQHYYTGYTVDLVKRYQAHLNGTGCKYTRSFKPLKLAQCWKINGEKAVAMKVERYIKKLPRVEKEKLISDPVLLADVFNNQDGVSPVSDHGMHGQS